MRNKKILIVGKRNHLGWLEHSIDGIKQLENISYDSFIRRDTVCIRLVHVFAGGCIRA